MALSAAQLKARENKLTASSVGCLMSGDETKLMNLWRELIGDPDYVRDDLAGVWPVQLGTVTEALNLEWLVRKRGGEITRAGEVVVGKPDWMACTLDGWSSVLNCPVECKHVGGYESFEKVLDRYQPQLHWTMMVTGARQIAISIIEGASEPRVELIDFNQEYADELMRRAVQFMKCVETLTPPVAAAPVVAPVIPVKVYDMTGNNEWGAEGATWKENVDGKKKAEKAEKALKSLVPADAVLCHGHGIEIKRNKAGSLSLKETKK